MPHDAPSMAYQFKSHQGNSPGEVHYCVIEVQGARGRKNDVAKKTALLVQQRCSNDHATQERRHYLAAFLPSLRCSALVSSSVRGLTLYLMAMRVSRAALLMPRRSLAWN